MTDRYNALLVVLKTDIRDDNLNPLIDAIKLFGAVLDVVPTARTGYEHQVAKMQVQSEMREQLWKVLTD